MKSGVFYEMECLTEQSPVLSGENLVKDYWRGDVRHIVDYLESFKNLNQNCLDFLGVETQVIGSRKTAGIAFRSGPFIGAIPLLSPTRGTQTGDFVVKPRYLAFNKQTTRFADYVALLVILKEYIEPEFLKSIPLIAGNQLTPPLYYIAFEYIKIFKEVVDYQWLVFSRTTIQTDSPIGLVNWHKHFKDSARPEFALLFECNKPSFTINHKGFLSLCSVYQKAKGLISISTAPSYIKQECERWIGYIDSRIGRLESITDIDLRVAQSDPVIVKKAKRLGQKLIDQRSEGQFAWRVDFSTVFERFCQYLFTNVGKETGGQLLSNPKISRINDRRSPGWSLKYIEPDMILQLNNHSIAIDAKYKSHLFNYDSRSDLLYEEHRNDLHQILSYSSFSCDQSPIVCLCYPSKEPNHQRFNYQALYTGKRVRVEIFGIPLEQAYIQPSIKMIKTAILSNFE